MNRVSKKSVATNVCTCSQLYFMNKYIPPHEVYAWYQWRIGQDNISMQDISR